MLKRNIHTPYRKHGNTAPFMRTEVSASFLRSNPQYKDLFRKCPVCNKFSFKPYQNSGRKCTKCGAFNDKVN